MMPRFLSGVILCLLYTLCGCSKPPVTDQQFLDEWRQFETQLNVSDEGAAWHFDFQSARLFRLNWDDEDSMRNLLLDGELNETRVPLDGIELTASQIERLEAAVTGSHSDRGIGACIYPHHAFLFYDNEGEIVGNIDVCFLCKSFQGAPKGYAKRWDLLAIAELIHDIGVPLRNPQWEQ